MELFELYPYEELDENKICKLTDFLTGTITASGCEAKWYVDDIVLFNLKWKPNWKKLYERFVQFKKDNPGSIEWACFILIMIIN